MNPSSDHFHTDAVVPSSDHCRTETVRPPSDHCCIDTVATSGDHYCIDIAVPSSDYCCTETVPPSSDHRGTMKVAPFSQTKLGEGGMASVAHSGYATDAEFGRKESGKSTGGERLGSDGTQNNERKQTGH